MDYSLSDGSVLRISNADENDQLFTLENVGSFNIGQIKRDLVEYDLEPSSVTFTAEQAREMLCLRDIDAARLVELCGQIKPFEPLLAAEWGPERQVLLLDGHHRLAIYIERGVTEVPAFVLTPAGLDFYRVTYAQIYPGGEQREVPAAEVLSLIQGTYLSPEGKPR